MSTYLNLRDHPRDQRGILTDDTSLLQLVEESIQAVRAASQGETNGQADDTANASAVPSEPPPASANVRPWLDRLRALPVQRLVLVVLSAVAGGLVVMVLSKPAPQAATARRVAPTLAASAAPASTATATAPAVEIVYGYWAPNGASAGELDLSKIARVMDVRGPWARVEMDGGGLVWTGTQEIPPQLLAAYTPPTATPRPYIPPTDPPAPAPTVCAEVGVPGKMVSACGYDLAALQQQAQATWLAQYGGNIGTVGQPTPQVRQP